MIYCINYFDGGETSYTAFLFTDKAKRDLLLSKLSDEYSGVDRELSDHLDVENNNPIYTVSIHYQQFIDFEKLNPLTDNVRCGMTPSAYGETQLDHVVLQISEDDFVAKDEEKYKAIYENLNTRFKQLLLDYSADEAGLMIEQYIKEEL